MAPAPTKLAGRTTAVIAAAALALGAFAAGPGAPIAAPSPAAGTATTTPRAPGVSRPAVVLELFTSQGCSSCPPADRLLARLSEERSDDLPRLVPLAFHVDYWNYIGWRDPFSAAAWSDRQRRYARALGVATVYTPQLVVDGREDLVGADERRARRAIARAAAVPAAGRVTLSAVAASDRDPGRLTLQVEAHLDQPIDARELEAWVALFENGLETRVRRGENAHRTLENEFVVRRLERALRLPAEPGATRQARATFALDPTWNRLTLGAAAFLQDPGSLRIHASTAASIQELEN